jgi:hypothetical protein
MSLEYIDADTGLPMLEKQPNETRRFYMDFAEKLRGNTIVSISSLAIASLGRIPSSAAVTPGTQSIHGDSITFTLAGGTSGEVYKVTVIIVDSAGQVLEGDGALFVTDF